MRPLSPGEEAAPDGKISTPLIDRTAPVVSADLPDDFPPLPEPIAKLRRIEIQDSYWTDWYVAHDEYWGPEGGAQTEGVYTADQMREGIRADRARRAAPGGLTDESATALWRPAWLHHGRGVGRRGRAASD